MRYARFAVRSLARRRGLALAIVGTLALSIGGATTIFAVVDTVLLRPLPYPGADRLVAVFETSPGARISTSLVAAVRLDEWSRASTTFEGIAGTYFENVTDTTGDVPERVAAMRTSPRFFTVLGVAAALGRTFQSDEEVFGGPTAVVLSDALWRARFGADPSMVGRTLMLGGVPRTIVGIMPASFQFPSATTEAWIPAQAPPLLLHSREARFYSGIGRLKAGVGVAQAQQELMSIAAQLGAPFPATDQGWSASVMALKEQMVGRTRTSLWLLSAAVLLVLAAACGNVAGLLLADSHRRAHHVAVQFALGATRWTIVRQRLLEGLLLSLAGSAGGLIIGAWGLSIVQTMVGGLPRATELGFDARLVAYALGTGVMTTVGFAVLPALHATRASTASQLGTRTHTGSRRLQGGLVAAQIALAVVLLVGAGLLLRSFSRLQETAPGFDASEVMAFRMSASWRERPEAVSQRQQRTLERLMAIPGVTDAAFTVVLAAGPDANTPPGPFGILGRPSDEQRVAVMRQVSAGYFRAMRMPVLRGRTCEDDPNGPIRVVINQALATRDFGLINPIGHRIEPRQAEIVAVVGDARERTLLKAPEPTIYFCGLAPFYPDPWFIVRTDAARAVPFSALRAAMREVEPQRAVYTPRLLREVVAESSAQARLTTVLFVCFGATAVLLVVIGLHGMLAQLVSERTREIGVRLALGARPHHAIAHVLRQCASITASGIGAGIAAALALARVMESLIFAIPSHDPLTFAAAALLLVLVACAATLLPARRAAHIDPLMALRD